MSKERIVKIPCPFCGKESDFLVYDSVNVTLDPELKQKVIDLDIFEFTCEHCHNTKFLPYPCLYHDMERNYMVYLCNEEGIKEWKELDPLEQLMSSYSVQMEYIKRGVTNYFDLISKINILDKGWDDKIVELIKYDCISSVMRERIQNGKLDDLMYSVVEDIDNEEKMYISLYFESQEDAECYVIDEECYNSFKQLYQDMLCDDGEILIDQEYAKRILGL